MRGGASTGRILVGVAMGIAVGILTTYLLEKDMLAPVLGSLAAMLIANANGVGQYVIVGLLTGAGIGLFMGATGNSVLNESREASRLTTVVLSLAATMIVSGLVGALYSFIAGEAKKLYDEGRGPYF